MADAFTTIDEYLATMPDGTRAVLEEIRRRFHAAVPDAQERISYRIPTMTLDGRNFAHFAGWAHHVSLYPVPDEDPALAAEFEPYVASKGTLKFPLGEPVPYDLVERIAAALAARVR